MDELDLQGKKYISSKRASELTGYAKDYVGQLARGNKVPATRVGRSWYVEQEAILKHAGKVQEDTASIPHILEKSQEISAHILESRKENLFSLQQLKSQGVQKSSFTTWGSVNYLEDNRELIPVIKTESKVNISSPSKEIKLKNIVTSHKRTYNNVKSMDGMTVRKNFERAPVVSVSRTKKEEKPKLLLSSHYALLGTALGVFLALVAIFSGLYTPSEWTYADLGNQAAFAGALEDQFSLLYEFFAVIFVGGVALIGDFLAILFNFASNFFEIGLAFIVNLF
ncbi:MAG: hypothetical protein AAB439_01525 [Patescibacteria group bacterium]